MFDRNGRFCPTEAQQATMARLTASKAWKWIGYGRDGTMTLCIPVGARYLDAIVAPCGAVSYQSNAA